MTTEEIALSEEKLRAMLAGCEGVTPGAWSRSGPEITASSKPSLAVAFASKGWCAGVGGSYSIGADEALANAAHIAACGPQTIRSLVTELLALRKAVKPFAALGQYILDEDLQTRLKEDAERMDWLVSQHVEVRTPMVYGSRANFVAQTLSSEEDAGHRTDLREQIDRARALGEAP